MSTSTSPLPQTRRRHRRIVGLAAASTLVGVLVVVAVSVLRTTADAPSFPSLADTPDPALHGTVAYFDDQTSCVRIVAAAGQPSRDVLCLDEQDPSDAATSGKLVGPELAWRDDGRLAVTMFRLTDPPGPGFRPGWQKLVDVTTGQTTDVPAAEVPSQQITALGPTVDPDGRTITTESDPATGHIRIDLTDPDGTTRTLLSARGPGMYSYRLNTAFWAPDFQWIVADDGRLLIVTPDDPVVTRILTDHTTGQPFEGARFAVTGADLLASE